MTRRRPFLFLFFLFFWGGGYFRFAAIHFVLLDFKEPIFVPMRGPEARTG